MVVVHIAAGALGVLAGLYLFSGYGLIWMLTFSVLTGNAAILISGLLVAVFSRPAPSLRAYSHRGRPGRKAASKRSQSLWLPKTLPKKMHLPRGPMPSADTDPVRRGFEAARRGTAKIAIADLDGFRRWTWCLPPNDSICHGRLIEFAHGLSGSTNYSIRCQ